MFGNDEDRRLSMLTARLTYQLSGYNVNSDLVDPQCLTVFSNLISKTVQLYFCHGNEDVISFEDGGLTRLGSGYRTLGLGDDAEAKRRYYYSVANVNMSHAHLITLASCKSSGLGKTESTSIAGKLYNNAADMVVGWYGDVRTDQLLTWLDNYHNALSKGYLVKDAIKDANNHLYVMFSGVQDNSFFYHVEEGLSAQEISELPKTNSKDERKLLDLSDKNTTIDEAKDIIISKNNDFNENNYEKEIVDGFYSYSEEKGYAEKENGYVNYYMKLGDFITNSGYVVTLDNNNNVEKIYDSTTTRASKLLHIDNKDNFKIEESDRQYYIDLAKSNVKNNEAIIGEKIVFFYDINKDEKKVYVTLNFDDTYAKSIETYTYSYDKKSK